MRTEQCYCVLEVVKTGSFTKAAENLFLKQPSLRSNIDKIEEELGQPLFNRTKQGCTLTAFGEWCYPQIVSIVETYEKMKKKVEINHEDAKPLLIGATRIFDEILGKSYNLYENQGAGQKCIFFSSSLNEDIVNRLLKKQLDVGLISCFPVLLQNNQWLSTQIDNALDSVNLLSVRVVALMRRDHPLAFCDVVPLEKLKNYLLVFFNYGDIPVLDIISHGLGVENSHLHTTKVADSRLVYKYLLEENGISFTLEHAKDSHPDSLKCIPMDERFVQNLVALTPRGGMNENIRTYISIIKALLK